jgi:hypothetical protein
VLFECAAHTAPQYRTHHNSLTAHTGHAANGAYHRIYTAHNAHGWQLRRCTSERDEVENDERTMEGQVHTAHTAHSTQHIAAQSTHTSEHRRSGVQCYVALCCAMLRYVVHFCAMLCCAMLCCAVLCCARLGWAVLCYVVLCYDVL